MGGWIDGQMEKTAEAVSALMTSKLKGFLQSSRGISRASKAQDKSRVRMSQVIVFQKKNPLAFLHNQFTFFALITFSPTHRHFCNGYELIILFITNHG